MAASFKAACIQNCATTDVDENIQLSARLMGQAADQGAKLIAAPEYFTGLHVDGMKIIPVAFAENDHPALCVFRELARARGVWLLLGSLAITAADGRVFNRGYMISPDGGIAARYDKIHMFDVDLPGGLTVRESATIAPGRQAVLADAAGACVGLSICYDLRFAALYRRLAQAGADVLAVPAAFTRVTGEAHWHVLNRARAIENGCYVMAPCQFGTLTGGARCYGHSLIIDPWGRVLADGGEGEGVIVADIDLCEVAAARARIPSLGHDRPFDFDTPVAAE